jgi:hypothetical protein
MAVAVIGLHLVIGNPRVEQGSRMAAVAFFVPLLTVDLLLIFY